MSNLSANATGLVALYMLKPFEGNMTNDIAGFEPVLAAALVNAKIAEPYDEATHKTKVDEFGGSKVKNTDARLQEVEAQRRISNATSEFAPAELLHEDMAEFREWQQERQMRRRVVPSTTDTYDRIKASGEIIERAAPGTDYGQPSPTMSGEAALTTSTLNADRADTGTSATDTSTSGETAQADAPKAAEAEKTASTAQGNRSGRRASQGDEPPTPPRT